jgi:hypothetical protein
MKTIISGVLLSFISLSAMAHTAQFNFKVVGAELAAVAVEAKAEFTARNCKELNFNMVIPYVPIFVPQREYKILESERQTKVMPSSGELEFKFLNAGKSKCDYYVSSVSVTLKKNTTSEYFIVYSSPNATDTRPMILDLTKYRAPGSFSGNTF